MKAEPILKTVGLLFLIFGLMFPSPLFAEGPSMSMTNTETGETTTITQNTDGSNTVTVTDSSGQVTSQGPPESPLPDNLTGAIRDDPGTGQRFVSVASGDHVISSKETFDPATGITTTTNILDPSIDGGRAQYVINPDGTQDSLVTLPQDTAGVISTDLETGETTVSLDQGDGTHDVFRLGEDGIDSLDPFGEDPFGPGGNFGSDIGFGGAGEVVASEHPGSDYSE